MRAAAAAEDEAAGGPGDGFAVQADPAVAAVAVAVASPAGSAHEDGTAGVVIAAAGEWRDGRRLHPAADYASGD